MNIDEPRRTYMNRFRCVFVMFHHVSPCHFWRCLEAFRSAIASRSSRLRLRLATLRRVDLGPQIWSSEPLVTSCFGRPFRGLKSPDTTTLRWIPDIQRPEKDEVTPEISLVSRVKMWMSNFLDSRFNYIQGFPNFINLENRESQHFFAWKNISILVLLRRWPQWRYWGQMSCQVPWFIDGSFFPLEISIHLILVHKSILTLASLQ